jgi:hypothetical protein
VTVRHGQRPSVLPYFRQPAHDCALQWVNAAAFTAPTETGLAGMRTAPAGCSPPAGPISVRLSALADVRYRSGPVAICQLG